MPQQPLQRVVGHPMPVARNRTQPYAPVTILRLEHDPAELIAIGEVVLPASGRRNGVGSDLPCSPFDTRAVDELSNRHLRLPQSAPEASAQAHAASFRSKVQDIRLRRAVLPVLAFRQSVMSPGLEVGSYCAGITVAHRKERSSRVLRTGYRGAA